MKKNALGEFTNKTGNVDVQFVARFRASSTFEADAAVSRLYDEVRLLVDGSDNLSHIYSCCHFEMNVCRKIHKK